MVKLCLRWSMMRSLAVNSWGVVALAMCTGCGSGENPTAAAKVDAPPGKQAAKISHSESPKEPPGKLAPRAAEEKKPTARIDEAGGFTIADDGDAAPAADGSKSTGAVAEATTPGLDAVAAPFDVDAAVDAGFRKLVGKHLTLLTDVPSSPAVDELPKVVDAAMAPWAEYLAIDRTLLDGWMLYAVLMKDRKKAAAAGLLPADLPQFLHGYARANMVWLDDQTTDYYRRHLLLHEATHATMYRTLGSAGPPWFSEGMAELLATHRWADGKLAVRYFPQSRDETPGLGRIRLIRDEAAANRRKGFAEVLAFDGQAHLHTEAYAWSWAACVFLDSHPAYRKKFPELLKQVGGGNEAFNVAMRQTYAGEMQQLLEEWQVFVNDLEHGYDFERTAIDFRAGKVIGAAARVQVRADRGWQNAGLAVETGKTYQLVAAGRYQLAKQPKVWMSEPNGVSIRYYQGRPLGQLLAVIHPDKAGDGAKATAFLTPTVVGLDATVTPEAAGTLYFKMNDSAGELADNAGELSVVITSK